MYDAVNRMLRLDFSGFPVYHVLPDKQAEHGPRGLLQRGPMRRPEEVRSPRPSVRRQSHVGPVQRGSDHSQAAVGTTWREATDSVHRLHRLDLQGVRGRRRPQVRAELALLDRYSIQSIRHPSNIIPSDRPRGVHWSAREGNRWVGASGIARLLGIL